LNLTIVFLPLNLVHIKLVPSIPESFERFDASAFPEIVNQTVASTHLNITPHVNETHICLTADSTVLSLQLSPFSIRVFNVTINPDDSAIFETNLPRDAYPDHWEHATFGGYDETLRDGPSSVAMTFAFSGVRTRFSGLPSHTLNLTLPSTIENGSALTDPIRFFNTDVHEYELNSPMAMYGSIPYLLGHDRGRTVSIFWCNPSETWVDVDNEGRSSRFVSETGHIDAFLISGTHRECVFAYTALTGRPALPQLFALGYHQCRWGYASTTELLEVSSRLDRAQIAHDALWLDLDHTDDKKYFTFSPQGFGDVRRTAKALMKSRRRLVALVDPHLKAHGHYRVYAEAREGGFLLRAPGGGAAFTGGCWPGKSVWVDFLSAEARSWWASQFAYSRYRGSGRHLFAWNDMNEPAVFDAPDCSVPRDCEHAGGVEDRAVHNLYGSLMVAATHAGLLARNPARDERPFVLTRSFFAGAQRYAWAWTGDNAADWDHLRASVAMVLALGVCGLPFIGADVGGFFGAPPPEMLARWFQAAAFCYPFFRCHCHHNSPRREPFLLQGPFLAAARRAIVERYELLSLWYTAARTAADTGEPVVRPLWWEFSDPRAQDIETQAIVGGALLVAPVLDPGVKRWTVYLPTGARWYEYRSQREVAGPEAIVKLVGMGDVPAYLRGGRIVAVRRTVRLSAEQMANDPFELIVALDEGGRAEGTLYADDGHSFAYESGAFLYRRFVYGDGKLAVEDVREGDRESAFVKGYRCTIGKIVIAGLEKLPKTATDERGRPLKVEIQGGNVAIRRTRLKVNEDWVVSLGF
jgi:alpha 1,3-glucosidase